MAIRAPAHYVGLFDPEFQPSAPAGSCRLTPTAEMVRPFQPMIQGGKRRIRHHKKTRKTRKTKKTMKTRKTMKQTGGFLPSIGEPFVAAVAKYVAPLALFGIYKFMTRKNKKEKKRV